LCTAFKNLTELFSKRFAVCSLSSIKNQRRKDDFEAVSALFSQPVLLCNQLAALSHNAGLVFQKAVLFFHNSALLSE
jgi:hypothetical protein